MKIPLTWLRTVARDSHSRSAICDVLRPSAR